MTSARDAATIAGRMASVGALAVSDRLGHGAPPAPGEVPPSADSVTPAWLTAVLCADAPGLEVSAVELGRRSSGTSSRAALTVSYRGTALPGSAPSALFAKAASTWKQRLLLGLGDMIHREKLFYGHVRPRVEMEAPAGYYADFDRRSWRALTLMEDVATTRGASFYDPDTPITPEKMDGLLATLAAMHGRFWESPMLFAELAGLTTPLHFKAKISALIGMRARSLAGARRAAEQMAHGLAGRQDDLWEAYGRSFELLSEAPMTVLHGDSHIGNTYATESGAMGFTDWQVTSKGGWAYDVAYTMTTGLTVADRRAFEAELLTGYLGRLASAGGPRLEFDDAWLSYRRSAPHAYFAWVFALGQGRLQPAMQPEATSREMIARTSQALVDLETLPALGL